MSEPCLTWFERVDLPADGFPQVRRDVCPEESHFPGVRVCRACMDLSSEPIPLKFAVVDAEAGLCVMDRRRLLDLLTHEAAGGEVYLEYIAVAAKGRLHRVKLRHGDTTPGNDPGPASREVIGHIDDDTSGLNGRVVLRATIYVY